MASAARKQAEEALETVRRGAKDHYGAAAMLFRALSALLAEPDGAGAKADRDCPSCNGRGVILKPNSSRCETDPCPTCRPAPSPASDEVARLTALLHECNAVCLCGCPESEHESYGEDGESCGHDDHECLRVPRSVLAYVETLRRAPVRDEVREAAEALLEDYDGVEDQLPRETADKVLHLRSALSRGAKGGE